MNMDLQEIRNEIDTIDSKLLDLFIQRMSLAKGVAENKKEQGVPVFDAVREREKLDSITSCAPAALKTQSKALFSLLMSMNKAEQLNFLKHESSHTYATLIHDSLLPAHRTFPTTARVCCQGVQGAYSQIAAGKLFEEPDISYAASFSDVFKAVSAGDVEFGVLPIENSTAGSVNAVYDLLGSHQCYIVRSLKLKIEHTLLAHPETQLENVREVISHEQALEQCAQYVEKLDVATTVCKNTAQAAQQVAASTRTDIAAISSPNCAELYGLKKLACSIQDNDSNYTRFVVIARQPAIYADANRSSIQITLKSEPGSLYRVLERIYSFNIDLVKLESRPVPGTDFEFSFYLDLVCPAHDSALACLLDSLADVVASCTYFGSYSEII